jgi:[histone H3]-lysine27 N-methyltransferase
MGAASQLRRRTRARTPPGPGPEATAAADDVRCEACGSGDAAAELMLCDGCDCGFHIFCLRPILPRVPAGDWYCPSCRAPASSKSEPAAAGKKPKREYIFPLRFQLPVASLAQSINRRRFVRVPVAEFPLVQTKIVDFFKIQRSPTPLVEAAELKKRKRKHGGALVASKKKSRRLLPFVPSPDPAQRLRQMASLATALTATGAAFSNELTYQPGMAPRSANRAALEAGGMQVLGREDAETLARCQQMMARGEWPPLVVAYDPVEGFTVEADRPIRDLTIITEYVGDVDFLRNREHDDGDSMMTLLSAASPARSLVICPDRRSNIARFINGINNHTP